ncbi:glycogen/starch/alpha-glucan phosphorylase, partial [Acinetobacter baumannii]|uniref:glycogen/starch/alpha-glucan phosphorylase n=1 Tax=Acinetobacter baumannii TaxID=470 RepID=UPI0031F33A37
MSLEKNRTYNFRDILNSNPDLQRVIRQLSDGTFSENKEEFKDILNHIYGEGDPYFVLKDFSAYVEAQNKINTLYENRRG